MVKKMNKQQLLKDLINAEKHKYTEAIKNNHKLEDVKNLYLKIKKLEKEADELMQQSASVETGDFSITEELHFLQVKQNFINKEKEYIAVLENVTLKELLNLEIYHRLSSLRYHSVIEASALSELMLQTITKNFSLK
jgi:hypothetical protein